jgi:anti-sigma factor RsiW
MSAPLHDVSALQLLMDGRLEAAAAERLRLHLAACAACSAAYADLQAMRDSLRRAAPVALPAELQQRLQAALRAEPLPMRSVTPIARVVRQRQWWRVAAALMILAIGLTLWWQPQAKVDAIAANAAAASAYRSGTLRLEMVTSTPATLEAGFRDQGIGFATRVFDLQMMGYQLLGGRRHDVAGRSSALYAYRGADGADLVCQMFVAAIDAFVVGAERRHNAGIDFFIHRRGDLTLVYWAEGEVICVLASTIDTEALVALAIAKAERGEVRAG